MGLRRGRSAPEQHVLARQAATPCIGRDDRPSLGLDELQCKRTLPQATSGHSPGRRVPTRGPSTPATGWAARTCSRSPSSVVHAPGHGWRARTRRSMRAALCRQSIQPSLRRNGRMMVAGPHPAGVVTISPATQAASSGGTTSAASSARRPSSSASSPPVELHRPLGDDRAGVQLGRHDHQRHPALRVAGEDGRGDRRGAAVSRQERGMHVERWSRGDVSRSRGTSWP